MNASPISPRTLPFTPSSATNYPDKSHSNTQAIFPNEIIGIIAHQAATPYAERSTAKALARLMRVSRSARVETNHQLKQDSVLRQNWMKEGRRWCENEIKNITSNTELTPELVRSKIGDVFAKTQQIYVDIGLPLPSNQLDSDLENNLIILDQIAEKTNLKILSIDAHDFQGDPDRLMTSLADILRNNPELIETKLYLSLTQITPDRIEVLSNAMCGKNFSRLSLSCNPINDDGALNLSKCFPRADIAVLDLWDCGIGDEGVWHLTRQLPTNLQTLSLANNRITFDGVFHLVQLLPSSKLKMLDLRNNPFNLAEVEAYLATCPLKNMFGETVKVYR